jgi:hypothetical protein
MGLMGTEPLKGDELREFKNSVTQSHQVDRRVFYCTKPFFISLFLYFFTTTPPIKTEKPALGGVSDFD